MAEEIDKNKGAWTDVTVRDLKQQYVVHLMMDVLNLDRNVNYSNKDELYFFLRRKFGKMVAKNDFSQIKRYLYFNYLCVT